jgi:tetratricopeptide (TPR) repeat protein
MESSDAKNRPRILIGGFERARRPFERGLASFADIVRIVPRGDEEKWGDGITCDGTLAEKLPDGWSPDYLLWCLTEETGIPCGIETLSCPTVAVVGGYHEGWLTRSRCVRYFDTFACGDPRSAQLLESLGAGHVLVLPMLALLDDTVFTNKGKPRYIDGAFIGDHGTSAVNPAYRKRDSILLKMLERSDEFRILVRPPFPDEDREEGPHAAKADAPDENAHNPGRAGAARRAEALNRARIGVIAGPSQELDSMIFEVMGCGALALVDENEMARRCFRDKEHLVYYKEDTFGDLFAYYLQNEEEREAIARRGWERVQEFAFPLWLKKCFTLLDESIKGRTADRTVPTPGSRDLLLSRGEAAYYAGRTDEALVDFRRALEMEPENPEIQSDVAAALTARAMKTGDRSDAMEALKHSAGALKINSHHIPCLFNLITLKHYVISEEYEKEFQHLCVLAHARDESILAAAARGVIVTPPPPHDVRMRCALSSAIERHTARGTPFFKGIMDVLMWQAHLMRAERFLAKGFTGTAIESIEWAIRKAGSDSILAHAAAHHSFRLGDLQKSLKYLDTALADSPLDMKSYERKVFILRHLGRNREALEVCRKALLLLGGLEGGDYPQWLETLQRAEEEILFFLSATTAPPPESIDDGRDIILESLF